MILKRIFIATLVALTIPGLAVVSLACDDLGKPLSDHELRRSRLVAAVKKVRPAIVLIQGIKKRDGSDDSEKPAQVGVGIVVDQKGVIVTGLHVVEGLSEIEIVLHDGRKIAAETVVSNRRSNVAIVTAKTPGCVPCARFADSDKVNLADAVLTLGLPFGNRISVVPGLVSATNRTTKGGEQVFQIDSSISPGGPNGPVVNSDGKVIGLVVPISNQGAQGIGLAIPSNRIQEILAEPAEKKQ